MNWAEATRRQLLQLPVLDTESKDYYTQYNANDDNERAWVPQSQSNANGSTMPIMEPDSVYTCTEEAYQTDYNEALLRDNDYSDDGSVESPQVLRYIFDANNKTAAKMVILTSYDTLSARTLQKPRHQPGDKDRLIQPSEWKSKWKGVFHTVILDDGHKVCNSLTQIHVAVARLCVKHHWFLTGTPVQNQSLDILGPLNILWPEIRKGAHLTKERIRWLGTLKGTYQDFDLLLEPDVLPTSWKCLIAADPYHVRQLLNRGNRKTINRLYRCMEQLLVLRQSTATSIPTDSNGSHLQLKSLMLPHEITTALLRMTSSEAAEYQFFHQGFIKDYEEGLEIWLKEKEHQVDPTADLKSFPCITGPMCSMTINAVSTLLSRFHQTFTHTKV
ncbi:hypothetical protein GMDG_02942 [Pseudogymnoascus destructans 20631-21]|uniref:SNF2 N-terminal domain-containing protein n=1 Tax=Pseudogymnoascus destructans (strain ATCC MYA-4855 / 20631-21) TaxID=658429 RepID=L8G4D1_PSED2|nr:hypothetical protein GMDG_02942 [Pseudogymnoascus destructans 20631-21]